MGEIVKRCDYLLIDAPAGISKDGVVPLAVADEVILVVNPELSSIVDALKTKILTEVVGGQVLGSIINRVDQEKVDVITKKMEKVLGVKVIGVIPEDPNVRRSAAAKTPIVVKYPASPATIAFKRIAADLVGVAYKEETVAQSKEGFIDRYSKALFRRK